MENASKALIMAASILIGIIVLSIGGYLFMIFSDYNANVQQKISDTQLAQFNDQFLKYQNEEKCTTHDIVSITNRAKQNNKFYELDTRTQNNYYIEVRVKGYSNKDFTTLKEEDYTNFLKEKTLKENQTDLRYFKCTNVTINPNTRRVDYIEFKEMP